MGALRCGLLGWDVRTVAGSGPVDVVAAGAGHRRAPSPRRRPRWSDALAAADLVVVENLCSLPLNPAAAAVVAAAPAPVGPACCTITTCRGSGRTWPTSPRHPTTRRGRTSPSTS